MEWVNKHLEMEVIIKDNFPLVYFMDMVNTKTAEDNSTKVTFFKANQLKSQSQNDHNTTFISTNKNNSKFSIIINITMKNNIIPNIYILNIILIIVIGKQDFKIGRNLGKNNRKILLIGTILLTRLAMVIVYWGILVKLFLMLKKKYSKVDKLIGMDFKEIKFKIIHRHNFIMQYNVRN